MIDFWAFQLSASVPDNGRNRVEHTPFVFHQTFLMRYQSAIREQFSELFTKYIFSSSFFAFLIMLMSYRTRGMIFFVAFTRYGKKNYVVVNSTAVLSCTARNVYTYKWIYMYTYSVLYVGTWCMTDDLFVLNCCVAVGKTNVQTDISRTEIKTLVNRICRLLFFLPPILYTPVTRQHARSV